MTGDLVRVDITISRPRALGGKVTKHCLIPNNLLNDNAPGIDHLQNRTLDLIANTFTEAYREAYPRRNVA